MQAFDKRVFTLKGKKVRVTMEAVVRLRSIGRGITIVELLTPHGTFRLIEEMDIEVIE